MCFSAGQAFSLSRGGSGARGLSVRGEMGDGWDYEGGKGGWVFKLGRSLCIFKRINSATGE